MSLLSQGEAQVLTHMLELGVGHALSQTQAARDSQISLESRSASTV